MQNKTLIIYDAEGYIVSQIEGRCTKDSGW